MFPKVIQRCTTLDLQHIIITCVHHISLMLPIDSEIAENRNGQKCSENWPGIQKILPRSGDQNGTKLLPSSIHCRGVILTLIQGRIRCRCTRNTSWGRFCKFQSKQLWWITAGMNSAIKGLGASHKRGEYAGSMLFELWVDRTYLVLKCVYIDMIRI